jgi:hypothetical protein
MTTAPLPKEEPPRPLLAPPAGFGGHDDDDGAHAATDGPALVDSGARCHACARTLYIGHPVVISGRFGDDEVCVCVCVYAYVRMCVCVCVCVCVCE